MNFVFGFRVANGHKHHTQKSSGVEALLASVVARIFHRDAWAGKNLLGIGKVVTVFFQVSRAFCAVPCEFHVLHYTYLNMYL